MNKLILKDKLKEIKDNYLSLKIFDVLNDDTNFKYTIKNNGLLFDINKLNNNTIDKINIILNDKHKKEKIQYKSYYLDKFDNSINEKEIKKTRILENLRIKLNN